jgi:hypothetical protein
MSEDPDDIDVRLAKDRENRRRESRKDLIKGFAFLVILVGVLSPFAPFYIVFLTALLGTCVLYLPDIVNLFRK